MQSFDPKQPLRGFKVLVPRGGNFGADIAEEVRLRGAFPVMAPLINFATPCGEDFDALVNAFSSLEAGHYNWLVVTHQTTVDVIYSMNVKIPPGTLVAASGETTAHVLRAAGYRVDFSPMHNHSARGLLLEWSSIRDNKNLNILWPRSSTSELYLIKEIEKKGHAIDSVVAFLTVGVPAPDSIMYDVENKRIKAILITSDVVAEQIKKQFDFIPEDTILAAIGPQTAKDARALGLRVDVVAQKRTVASLLDGIEWCIRGEPLPETTVIDLRDLFNKI